MPRALKVFRTAAGFHDAYVAAPSKAAALRAWGSDNDLFARGAAEEITDKKLMAAPLAHPGQVIRKSRGSLSEQLAALPKDRPRRANAARPTPETSAQGKVTSVKRAAQQDPPSSKSKPAPKPRPSRARLDRAEAAAVAIDNQAQEKLADIANREAALRSERRSLEKDIAAGRDKAAQAVDLAKAAYDRAMDRWRAEL